MSQPTQTRWWQTAVFYQIYPRSFADGNGDGIGDFPGMTARLDHLVDLGVDAIWLSPHYPSPFLDCGYDISDFSAVAPEYGTLEDFCAFLAAAHARGLRVILDLVLNHSADQHPWFVASRSSRSDPQRDWYIWRDPAPDGGPPNNWQSIFGGSAWEYDAASGQYYYHAFLKEQPDLNWRNPALKAAMWQMVRFWLDLGVDGFRLDAIATIYEHPGLPDHTLDVDVGSLVDVNRLGRAQYFQLMGWQLHQPGIHELMQELRAIVNEYPGDRLLVGEDEDAAFHGQHDDELHLVFNFPLMRADRLTPQHVRANQAQRLGELPPGAWPCNTLGNHDTDRVWTRYGDGVHNAALARLHAALLLTLRGTPFLYNGEEIGMRDLELTRLDQLRDTAALARYARLIERGGYMPEAALHVALATTRDRCRGPLHWSAEANAGFSPPGVQTWLPVDVNHAQGVNVADQQRDPASLFHFYRHLLQLRRATPALQTGDYYAEDPQCDDCFAFTRADAAHGQRVLVVLNFSAAPHPVRFAPPDVPPRLLFSSAARASVPLLSDFVLAPFEVLLVELSPGAYPGQPAGVQDATKLASDTL